MNIVDKIKKSIKQLPKSSCWIIAYSGGVDSCVLTNILAKLKPENIKLKLIHVNHGLGQKEAIDWVKQAKDTAKIIGAEFITTEFNMDETENGLEEKARKLRHGFIESQTNEGDLVFMGHHKNDQSETILFRLCRGTGIKGLSGIPFMRDMGKGKLCRPMLDVSRKEILDYAISNNIHWFEDDTNIDLSFSRNFFRHKVIPLLETRWGNLIDQIKRLSEKANEMQKLNNEIALMDLNFIKVIDETKQLKIDCERLYSLSILRQNNVISYIIEEYLNLPQESKNFKNTLMVLLTPNKNYSKVRKLDIKNITLYNNGKYIWKNKE